MEAIATVSMYDMGANSRNTLNRSQSVEQCRKIIATAAEQRYAAFAGSATQYTRGTVHELTANTDPMQREFLRFLPHQP